MSLDVPMSFSRAALWALILTFSSIAGAEDTQSFGARHTRDLELIFYDTTDFSVIYTAQPHKSDTEYSNLYMELDTGISVGPDTGGVANLIYNRRSFRFSKDLPGEAGPYDTSVQSFTLQTAFGSFFTENFGAAFLFQPSVDSDLRGFGGDDVQYIFGPLANYKLCQNLALQAGALTTISASESYAYPVLGVAYTTEDGSWRTNIGFPVYARVGYFPAEKTELYSMLSYARDDYHAYLGEQRLPANVRINTLHLGTGVASRIVPKTLLRFEGGYSFGMDYELLPAEGAQIQGTMRSGFYGLMELGFYFR